MEELPYFNDERKRFWEDKDDYYKIITKKAPEPKRPTNETLKENYIAYYNSRKCSYCESKCNNMKTIWSDHIWPTSERDVNVCQQCLKEWTRGNKIF